MRFRILVFLAAALLAAGKDKVKPGKNPAWPPKAGIKTPGIQIPFANLKPEAEWTMEGTPAWIASEGQNILVPLRTKGTIARITNRDNKTAEAWGGMEEPCGGLVSAFGSLWAPDCKKQSISRLEPRSGKITGTVTVGVGKAQPLIASSPDSVWVLSDDKVTLSRLDPKENQIVSELRLGASCNSLQFEQNALWVTCPAEGKVIRVNPGTNLVSERIETAAEPVALTFGEGHIWVLGNKEGKISKIDPKTNKVVATIETGVPNGNGTLSYGAGAVWVSQDGYPLTKVDAKTDKVLQQFAGEGGNMVRFAAGSVWLLHPAKMTVTRFDPKRVALTLPD